MAFELTKQDLILMKGEVTDWEKYPFTHGTSNACTTMISVPGPTLPVVRGCRVGPGVADNNKYTDEIL